MKTIKALFLVLICSTGLAQESVSYKITEDEPRKINNFSCNIDLAHMDAGFSNLDGVSFNCGVWGHAMFKQRLGIDYTLRYGWLTLGKYASKDINSHVNIQAGGFLIFASRQPIRKNKIIMKSVTSGRTTTTTYLMVPSQRWKYTALRGGLYFDKTGYRIEDDLNPDIFGNAYIMGAYGGICFGSSKRTLIQTDKYGEKGVLSHMRVCLDVLITPISNAPSSGLKTSPIGGRLLVQGLPSLQRKMRKRKYNAPITYEFEFGYRSIAGAYLGCTLSIPVSRNIKAFQTKEEDQTIKRTTE